MGKVQLATWFFLAAFVCLSHQATDDGVPPVLTVKIASVDLNQEENHRVVLGGGAAVITCADADGDQIRAYIERVNPTSGCGLRCLQLVPCTGSASDYCLWFLGSEGTLDFTVAPTYTLTVACTDDLESLVTQEMALNVLPNSPPSFVPNTPLTDTVDIHGLKTTHNERQDIYKVETTDPEDDPVYYTMSTSPITDGMFEIEYTTGQIVAAHDLKLLCEEKVVASIRARDQYNPAVGPFTLDINIDNNNERPTVTNLDTTVSIDENEFVDKRVIEFDVIDNKLNDLNYYQRSLTSAGMEVYGIRAPSLRTLEVLNYEREDTRSVKLYFDIDDGYCRSETYSLTVNVIDLPEGPKYTSYRMLIMTDEGEVNEPNNVFILDEDLNEIHTNVRASGTSSLFDVDPATGNIISYDRVLLNPGVMYKDYNVRMRVEDKDGLRSSRYEGRVRLFDINDHRPYFTNTNNPLKVSAHECLPAGTILSRVKGADDDSEYNLNNWVYFGGGGGKFSIAANGWVVLTEQCQNGETFSGTATISDQGINPGPLTGDPMEVLLICGPCPVPGEGDADDSGSSNTTTTSSSVDGSGGSSSGPDTFLIWAVPALLGVVAWLALTGLLMYHFCRRPCQSSPKPIRITPEHPQPEVKPPQPPSRVPPPPPPKPKTPPPVPPPRPVSPCDPYLFGFWKETYTNQDQNKPASKTKPKAIEEMPLGEGNPEPPSNLRLGPPGANMPRFLSGNVPAAASGAAEVAQEKPKKKFCTIL